MTSHCHNYAPFSQFFCTGHRGVICELLLNFTIDTTHRLCFYMYCKIEQTIIQSTYKPGNIIHYPVLQKTTEGNDCGQITATEIR